MKVAIFLLLAFFVAVTVAGPTKVDSNNVGDIVTVGVNADLKIKSKIDQDIINVIVALLNDQSTRIG
ncbi:CLUMA_CG017275, isoform A [Clunio marinus]|uniref:CLUMA_CG017275, isoform A n=1 Tax=Clunio marinus TaxID=568069 RepID=A0A1J1IX81_9DIPT|nr:CLUMA_CG017275, isoform A [Clunio marinus]